jgi:elongation factor G
MALKEAVRKASPVLLEPVMKVAGRSTKDYIGPVMGNLISRRLNRIPSGVERGIAVLASPANLLLKCLVTQPTFGP